MANFSLKTHAVGLYLLFDDRFFDLDDIPDSDDLRLSDVLQQDQPVLQLVDLLLKVGPRQSGRLGVCRGGRHIRGLHCGHRLRSNGTLRLDLLSHCKGRKIHTSCKYKERNRKSSVFSCAQCVVEISSHAYGMCKMKQIALHLKLN